MRILSLLKYSIFVSAYSAYRMKNHFREKEASMILQVTDIKACLISRMIGRRSPSDKGCPREE